MEVRKFKWLCILLVVMGLVAAIPTVAGERPQRDDAHYNTGEAEGYHPTVPEQAFPPYEEPQMPMNGATLDPPNVNVTLAPGQIFEEHKVLHMPAYPVPPKADILFVIDLTGSMSEELENVKLSAVAIMNAIRGMVPDTYFGVISHMDYLGLFDYCQYQQIYGSGPDYPYNLGQGLTGDMNAVQTAINALVMGRGEDGSETMSRMTATCLRVSASPARRPRE
jgi:hypothetical protein